MERRKKTFCCTQNEEKNKKVEVLSEIWYNSNWGKKNNNPNCFITHNTQNKRKTKERKRTLPKNPINKKKV